MPTTADPAGDHVRFWPVSDGELNLEFDPETDFASIAAIKVLKPIS